MEKEDGRNGSELDSDSSACCGVSGPYMDGSLTPSPQGNEIGDVAERLRKAYAEKYRHEGADVIAIDPELVREAADALERMEKRERDAIIERDIAIIEKDKNHIWFEAATRWHNELREAQETIAALRNQVEEAKALALELERLRAKEANDLDTLRAEMEAQVSALEKEIIQLRSQLEGAVGALEGIIAFSEEASCGEHDPEIVEIQHIARAALANIREGKCKVMR